VGITRNKDLVEFWDSIESGMCYTEEIEIDSPSLMRDCRITGEYGMRNSGFDQWKKSRKKKRK